MRTRRQLASGLAVVLGSAALAGPVAANGQDLRSPDAVDAAGAPVTLAVPGADLRSPDAVDAATPTRTAPKTAVVVQPAAAQPSTASGFDWGSAAVGAAGVLGLIAVAAGGVLALHRRRGSVPPSAIAH